MSEKHWTEKVPLFYEIAGLGEIRILGASEANSLEQSFMSLIRREVANRSND